jgi:hypothetical protein
MGIRIRLWTPLSLSFYTSLRLYLSYLGLVNH